MKKLILHIINWVGYYAGLGVLGHLLSKLYFGLFEGFLSDESYAAEHPYRYLLGFFGILFLGMGLVLGVVWFPLTKLMEFIDSKIEDIKDKDDEEWD